MDLYLKREVGGEGGGRGQAGVLSLTVFFYMRKQETKPCGDELLISPRRRLAEMSDSVHSQPGRICSGYDAVCDMLIEINS